MPQVKYLCEFSHPCKWADIFSTIIEKLGPDFGDWDRVSFMGVDDEILVLHHKDKEREVYILLQNINVCVPAVAGGWFTTLRERRNATNVAVNQETVHPTG